MPSFFHYQASVYQNVFNTSRVLVRIFESGPVFYSIGIKNNQVRFHPSSDPSPICYSDLIRGHGSSLFYSRRQIEYPALPGIVTQHSRIGTVGARMGPGLLPGR